MNGVVGMTEMLLSTELDAVQRNYADIIRQSAMTLLSILNDILDFSKIEAGQLKPETTPFRLRQVTDSALQLLAPQVAAKGLSMRVDWPEELPDAVIGDPTRYAQVITNLLGNALKFTSQGHIGLRARLSGVDGAALRFRFEIEDSGIGIHADIIPRLFESFTQSDSSITRKYGGTGLGLAIVRRLCRLMGGDCGVTSEYGKGSCFWFSIVLLADPRPGPQPQTQLQPAPRPAASTAAGAPAAGAPAGVAPAGASDPGHRKLHVLLVEDNAINQEVARGMLEYLGCEIEIAENGRCAVERLGPDHTFDLVLMDCQMPEMDGLEATRRIRILEAGGHRHTPIVALTANAMVGDREQCISAGMDDFLSKPFQLRDLSGKLDAWRRH